MLTVNDFDKPAVSKRIKLYFLWVVFYLNAKIILRKLFGKHNSIEQHKGIFFLKKYPEITF